MTPPVDAPTGHESIRTTEEHPFFVEGRGFVNASELAPGDRLSSGASIASIASTIERSRVHNFEVEGFHTYFVGRASVLVHNQCANPRLTPAVNNLAGLLLEHRTDEASHRRALELTMPYLDSRDPSLVHTLGWAYYRTGDYVKAVQSLERTVAQQGSNPVARYHLGMAYMKTGDTFKARQQFEESLKIDPKYPGSDEARKAIEELQAES